MRKKEDVPILQDRMKRKIMKLTLNSPQWLWNCGGFKKIYFKLMSGRISQVREVFRIAELLGGSILSSSRWPDVLGDYLAFCWTNHPDRIKDIFQLMYGENEDFQTSIFGDAVARMLRQILKEQKKSDVLLEIFCSPWEAKNPVQTAFFKSWGESFHTHYCEKEDCSPILDYMEHWIERQTDPIHIITGYQLIYSAGWMNSDSFCKYFSYLSDLNLKDCFQKYWSGVFEVAWMLNLHTNFVYPDYYLQRKKFLKKIAQELYDHSSDTILNSKDPLQQKTVVILVNGIYSRNHASARLEVGIANELARRGYHVTLYVADSNVFYEESERLPLTISCREQKYSSKLWKEDHNRILMPWVKIVYNDKKDICERFNETIRYICQLDPELVIDISWEQAIFTPILIRRYPTIMVPLNGISTSASFDAYIVRDKLQLEQENTIYHSVENCIVKEGNIFMPYPIFSSDQSSTPQKFKREKYGICKDDFVIVSAGQRLDTELPDELVEAMSEYLNFHKDVKWILVGSTNLKLKKLEKAQKGGQVIIWPFEPELFRLYMMCDVCLNPPRTGGAGGVLLAVQCGLPVVILDISSDTLPFIGTEYCVHGGVPEIIQELEQTRNDLNYRKRKASDMFDKIFDLEFSAHHFCDMILSILKEVNLKN